MLNKLLNYRLIQELKSTVLRIPKDLKIWEKEIARLNRKKDKKSQRIKLEYFGLYRYYYGKMFAYVFVLQQLGNWEFARDFYKKRRVVWRRRERGELEELKTRREYDKHPDKYWG